MRGGGSWHVTATRESLGIRFSLPRERPPCPTRSGVGRGGVATAGSSGRPPKANASSRCDTVRGHAGPAVVRPEANISLGRIGCRTVNFRHPNHACRPRCLDAKRRGCHARSACSRFKSSRLLAIFWQGVNRQHHDEPVALLTRSPLHCIGKVEFHLTFSQFGRLIGPGSRRPW